ncbi:RNA/RNP complex-1-interacting phosphatase-like [Pocillopora verrucosa]|uniref:RNA/RNP complex-1-interacting phosphatase-like n=1 Tax=Pocillopora verrucosa TaxID=203993 RepID=UPI00333ED710
MFRFSRELPGFVYLGRLLSLTSLRFYRKMNTEVVIDKRIPDKWRDYKPCGVPIPGERIIAFKTPLSHQYDNESDQDNGIKPHERFTPMDLLNCLNRKHIKLGMVVDFTNTYRYYNYRELSDHGILHCKIKCVGKEIPDENVVKRFKTEVCSFLDKRSNSDAVVGVHCTHGLNRSGYVVCRYLIECRGYTPEEAIKAFNKARGHDMERENYLEDLHKKIPEFDFTSFVRVGDNRKQDEIQFDRPRHLHTNSRYASRNDAFEENKTNSRSSNYIRGSTSGYNDFRSRYQQVDRYQPTGTPTQRRHYTERRFRSERHREDDHDTYSRYDDSNRTYYNPERDHRNYPERNYNDHGDGYFYSDNYCEYGREYETYASSSRPRRSREDSYRRDHVKRTSLVRDRPKPYAQRRK